MVGTCPPRDMTSDSEHKQIHGMALMLLFSLSFPSLHVNIQSIALYILVSIPMVMCRKWAVACGCCPFVAAILPQAPPPPLWCRRRSQEQAAHSADRSTWSSRAQRAHYAHTTLLHRSLVRERRQAPVVVVLRGNRPGNLGLGPELPALWTTYPASLYKCSALLSNMNNCNLRAFSTVLDI